MVAKLLTGVASNDGNATEKVKYFNFMRNVYRREISVTIFEMSFS